MFDNLKEKLGSFRSDAEETAEENAEEIDPAAEDGAEGADDELEGAAAEGNADGVPEDPPAGGRKEGAIGAATGAETAAESGPESREREPSEPDAAKPEGDAPTDDAIDAAESTGDAAESAGDDDPAADESGGPAGFGRKARSLVRGRFVIEEGDLEEPLRELELALLSSDVEMGVAEEITDRIEDELVGETRTFTTSTAEVVSEAVEEAILDVIDVGQFDFDERIAIEDKPVVVVFTGVNGVGKTTTIAKLHRYLESRGYSTVLANGDTYRAGANEQIREHAENLDAKLITHDRGGDPAAVLYDAVEYAEANDVDVVLGDTAGRLHTNQGLMDQLEKIDRVVDPDLTLFVDEAVAGQDAVNRAREFDEAATIDGAVLTKADADADGGAAISIAHVTGKPILFLGVGQGYDDLVRFDPEEMAERLLEDGSEE